jgi:hypothetical protein
MSSLRNELKQSEAILSKRTKLRQAIENELQKLQSAIDNRLEAESAVAQAQIAEVVGESGGTVERAKKALNAALTAIEEHGTKLRALRKGIVETAPELARRYDGLNSELPGHLAAVTQSFTEEWNKAVSAFSQVLSRRSEIERLLGQKLALTEPTVSPVGLGDEVEKPQTLLAEIRESLDLIAGHAPVRHDPKGLFPVFDSRKVYVLTTHFADQSGPTLEPGTRVVECSLEPGWLDHLTAIGYAIPHVDTEQASAALLAQNKASRIRQQAEQQNEHGHPTLYPHDAGGVSRGGSIH